MSDWKNESRRLIPCVTVAFGLILLYHSLAQPSPCLGQNQWLKHLLGKAGDEEKILDFKSAVENLAAAEQPRVESPKPNPPKELQIVSAKYGARDSWLDVTKQVKEKVDGTTLSLEVSNAIAEDPLYGKPKTLKIEYIVDGKRKTAELREGTVLNIPPDPFDELKIITTPERLNALAEACPAEVGFYGKNLVTGKTVAYRPDQPACLASIVKIFVLLEVICQADQGKLDLSKSIVIKREGEQEKCTISAAIDKMIGISDNEATGALATLVGYDRVNALPQKLGIKGLSDQILPEPGLDNVLDKRVFGKKILPESALLPQHGTARGIVRYFELLHENKLISENVSRQVLEVFDRNPKCFAPRATPNDCKSGGKGGSLVWIRPFFTPYNMVGWAILIRNQRVALAYCLWYEWFPNDMSDEDQWRWASGLSDCIVNVLLLPATTPPSPLQ
ncbi:MAG: serine hydrolase [Planctomycetota bacterium]